MDSRKRRLNRFYAHLGVVVGNDEPHRIERCLVWTPARSEQSASLRWEALLRTCTETHHLMVNVSGAFCLWPLRRMKENRRRLV
jgi:hypothetical protein